MIDFSQVIDFTADLKEQVQVLLHEFITEHSSDDEEYKNLLLSYAEWKCEPRVIGKEKCGVMIFTWQCVECPYSKTFIASYQPSTKISKLLIYQEKALTIVNASLNSDDTLLCFTTVEKASRLDKSTDDYSDENFNAYIAEICPQNRVFSLNVEWNTYQKVQFLNEYPCPRNRNKFQMVFCHHKNAIQLYQISVQRFEDGRVIMREQPTTQQIARHFIWSKFDVGNQRLFYLTLLPQDEEEMEAAAVLTAIEFKSDGTYEYVMNFILPLQLKMELMRNQSFYNLEQYSNIVSCKTFTMDLLTENAGSFYVCFQHPVMEERFPEEESSEDDQSVISESSISRDSILQSSVGPGGSCFVNYTIICVHGGYTVHCSSSLPLANFEENYKVCFTLFNDYVLVFLPNSFLHLLDISCEHEPVHSLLIRSKEFLPKVPCNSSETLSFTSYSDAISNSQGVLIFEASTQTVYQLDLNVTILYKFFLSSKPHVRMSVLHACLNHFKPRKLIRKILERICQDPANADSDQMLKEYLILAPYVEMKRLVGSSLDLKVFPFTTQSCYRGQVERNAEGHRDVYLSFKNFHKDLIAQIQKVLRNSQEGFWKNVIKHMAYEGNHRNKRVPLNKFYLAAVDSLQRPMGPGVVRGRRNTSFVIIPRMNDSQNLDDSSSVSGKSPTVDDNALDEDRKINESLNRIATECLVNYVTRYFGQETKIKAENMCREYMTIRCRTINTLWKTVLKALGNTDEGIRFKDLSAPVDELERAIFQIVERMNVIRDQLCYPQITNMNDLLCTLSFRCLSPRQFMFYLDAQVISADVSWVRRSMRELPQNTENVNLIMDLVMRLDRGEAHKILLEWNHPIGNRYLAQYISWKMPCDLIHHQNAHFEPVIPNEEEFIPLKTLLHAFRNHGKPSSMFGSTRGDKRQDDFLRTSALSDTTSLFS